VSFATWALPRLYRLLRGTPSVQSSTAPVAISPYSLASWSGSRGRFQALGGRHFPSASRSCPKGVKVHPPSFSTINPRPWRRALWESETIRPIGREICRRELNSPGVSGALRTAISRIWHPAADTQTGRHRPKVQTDPLPSRLIAPHGTQVRNHQGAIPERIFQVMLSRVVPRDVVLEPAARSSLRRIPQRASRSCTRPWLPQRWY